MSLTLDNIIKAVRKLQEDDHCLLCESKKYNLYSIIVKLCDEHKVKAADWEEFFKEM